MVQRRVLLVRPERTYQVPESVARRVLNKELMQSDGNPWTFIRSEPYTRISDDTETILDVYERTCEKCPSKFTIRIPHRSDPMVQGDAKRRRCDEHAKSKSDGKKESTKERSPPVRGRDSATLSIPSPLPSGVVIQLDGKRTKSMADMTTDELALELEKRRMEEAKSDPDLDYMSIRLRNELNSRVGDSDRGEWGSMVFKPLLARSSSWAPIRRFVADSRLGTLTKNERLAVFGCLAEQIVDEAVRIASITNQPLTPRLVVSQCANVHAIIDAAFPGYLRCRVFMAVARRFLNPESTRLEV